MRVFAKSLTFALCVLTCAVRAPAYADEFNLPNLGDEANALVSPYEQQQIGAEIMAQLRHRDVPFINDPELADYIQSLGERLVAHSPTPNHPFRFYLVDDPTINAEAMWGGYVLVDTGLVTTVQNESELAAVLSHEISHIAQNHLPRMLAEQKHTQITALAGLIAALLLAGSSANGAGASIAVTTGALAQNQLSYSREFEEEADRVGMKILAASGFDPRAMPEFFERMQAETRLNETDLPEFLRDHPVTDQRIAEAWDRANQYPRRHVGSSMAFYLVRARIVALYSPGIPHQIAQQFRDNLRNDRYQNADAERYGYALALMRDNQYAAARRVIATLVQKSPDRMAYRIAQAEIEFAAGDVSGALKHYQQAYGMAPDDFPLAYHYARALLAASQPRAATPLLRKLLRRRPDDPELYKMMADATGSTGDDLEAHRNLAEYYYLNANLGAAVEQLQLARRYAGNNYYQRAGLDARIKEIQGEIKAQRHN